VDISEDDQEYLIKAELPEVKKEDVKVTAEEGTLTITGERKFEKEEKGKKYHKRFSKRDLPRRCAASSDNACTRRSPCPDFARGLK